METEKRLPEHDQRIGPQIESDEEAAFRIAALGEHTFIERPRKDGNRMMSRVETACDCFPLQSIHHVGDMNLPGTLYLTGVARRAEPDRETIQNFILETLPGHRDDLAGGVVHVMAQRACGAADATLDATEEFLAVGSLGDALAEGKIEFRFELDSSDDGLHRRGRLRGRRPHGRGYREHHAVRPL